MEMAAGSAVVPVNDYEYETRPPYLHVCSSFYRSELTRV